MTHRYVVIGAGAVGASIAAGLKAAGRQVVLVSRGATYDAIAEHGLQLTHNGTVSVLDVPVVDGPGDIELTPDDRLVLAVKTQDAESALAAWAASPVRLADGQRSTAGAAVTVITTQNGLDAERSALRHFASVIAAVALTAAQHVVPGRVRVFNAPRYGQLIVGAYPPEGASPVTDEVVASVVDDLDAANWLVQDAADIRTWKAWKLLSSVTFAASVFSGSETRIADLKERLRQEAREVLLAHGLAIADPATEIRYDPSLAAIAQDPDYDPARLSPWQSFARGSGSEIDYLNGEVSLLARSVGIPAPFNAAVQYLLAAAAASGLPPQSQPVDHVFALAEALLTPTPGELP